MKWSDFAKNFKLMIFQIKFLQKIELSSLKLFKREDNREFSKHFESSISFIKFLWKSKKTRLKNQHLKLGKIQIFEMFVFMVRRNSHFEKMEKGNFCQRRKGRLNSHNLSKSNKVSSKLLPNRLKKNASSFGQQ